jgi:hypothetical protein
MPTPKLPEKPGLDIFKQAVFGLVVACPFDQKSPPDCQLCEIQRLDLKERFAWVSALTQAEAKSIWAHHEKCLMEKKRSGDSGHCALPACRAKNPISVSRVRF